MQGKIESDKWRRIIRMEINGLIRSMSKKAFSPDKSACLGFFGRVSKKSGPLITPFTSWTVTSITSVTEEYSLDSMEISNEN